MNRRHFLQSTAAATAASFTVPAMGAEAVARPAPAATATAPFGFAGAPVLLNPAPDGVTVLALPNALASGWVEYGPTKELGMRVEGDNRGQHLLSDRLLSFRIGGLKPGQRCYYRVHLRRITFKTAYSIKPGDEIRSEIYSFRTLNPDADTATFTVWNDTHEHATTLQRLSESLNANPTDFLFWNGDVTNDVRDESKIISQFLAPAGQPFAASVPYFLTRGNHDVRGRDARALPEYVLGPGGEYFFAFRHGPVAAIVLDSGEDKPDRMPVYAGLNDFAAYRSMQRGFLEKAIADPAFTSAPFRILFVHIPLFWETTVPADWPGVWGNGIKGWICEDGLAKWHDLLVKGRIDLVISGHTHKHAWFPPNEKHPYAQLIGGGPKEPDATSIIASATPNELKITVKNLDGKALIEQAFKPQG